MTDAEFRKALNEELDKRRERLGFRVAVVIWILVAICWLTILVS